MRSGLGDFQTKLNILRMLHHFHCNQKVIQDFESLKQDIVNASLSAIDKEQPYVVECDAFDIAISATLNQSAKLEWRPLPNFASG